MKILNLPKFEFKIRQDTKHKYIYDFIRNKYYVLTEEEWVRQNILRYLVDVLSYPPSLLGVEKQIEVLGTPKRPDIIVFDKQLKPKMIVECKSPAVTISEKTLKQAINYFLELKSDYFLLTNGKKHYCCKIINNECNFINYIPQFNKI